MRQVVAGTDRVYALAKKYKIKTAFGTDILFSPALAERQGAMLADLTRWYTPAEALIMATSTNAELLALSGPAIHIPASSASSKRARSPTCCWSTATRWRTSGSSQTRRRTFSSS